MYNFIVNVIRRGIAQCSKRLAVANNKYVSAYGSVKKSNNLTYLDVNNLYGYAMSQYLPYNNFKELDNCDNFNTNNLDKDSKFGYILKVDLKYPTSNLDHYSDFIFCTENKKIKNMKQRKLTTDLNDKINYVIHYRILQ